MIPIYSAAGARLALVYNSLTLNNPSDDVDDTYEVNSVITGDALQILHEALPNTDGSELSSEVRKQLKIIRIDGTMRAPSLASYFDKRLALALAFDAAKIDHENTDPYLALTFSTPTTDTTTYPTGLVASKYLVLPRKLTLPAISMYTGLAGFFSIELEAIDPRRYLQTAATAQVSGTGTSAFANSKADTYSWPTVTITATGAGSATYQVSASLSGLTNLTLDLSGLVNTDVVTVNMATKLIQKNGTDAPQLYVSGDFFPVEPYSYQAASLTVAGGTNMTTVASWYPALVD